MYDDENTFMLAVRKTGVASLGDSEAPDASKRRNCKWLRPKARSPPGMKSVKGFKKIGRGSAIDVDDSKKHFHFPNGE